MDIPPSAAGSLFPWSKGIITGGSFTMETHLHTSERSGFDRLAAAAAPNAHHNSGHMVDPPKCHPGTRVAIIQTLVDWVAGLDEQNRDKFITWVTGAAGAGKSAIGRSVCERCAEEGMLLASFFFGASDPTRNHSKSLAATITYQICAGDSNIRKLVSEFIERDPLILTQTLRTQFTALVMEPLKAIYANSPQTAPRLIVLDGLDECVDLASQRDILDTLYHVVTISSIPIRILVLSRPESNISSTFSGAKINSTLFKIFLGDEYHPDDDIRHYLCDKFTELREKHIFKASIPPGWPTEDQTKKLVDKSSGQFVYVTTVIGYLNSPRHRPHQRLDAVLGLRPPFKDLPFAELDALYTHLLNSTEDPSLSANIMAFLALYDEITPSVIDVYLNLEDGTAEVVLSDLTAIVRMVTYPHLPASQEAVLLHKSFGDFLFDAHRSKALAKNQAQMHVGHLVRLIEIFSGQNLHHLRKAYYPSDYIVLLEGCNGPRCPSHPEDDTILKPFRLKTLKSHWFESSYAAFRIAVGNFPMEFYCKNLFQQQLWEEVEHIFLSYLFGIMFNLEHDGHLAAGTYHNHALTFYNLALFELASQYSNDWEMHYIFARYQLQVPGPHVRSKGLGEIFYYLSEFRDTLLNFLSNEEKSLIISKAAVYFLNFLVDASLTNQEAESHLQLHWIDRKKQRTRPWKWHRRTSLHDLPNKFVLLGRYSSSYIYCVSLVPYTKLINAPVSWEILPVQSVQEATQWKLGLFKPDQQLWHKYRELLEYLPQILPLAARFPVLVDICRTKCFAKMSMMFPKLSRRAHRAITTYLDRVGAGSDDAIDASGDN